MRIQDLEVFRVRDAKEKASGYSYLSNRVTHFQSTEGKSAYISVDISLITHVFAAQELLIDPSCALVSEASDVIRL